MSKVVEFDNIKLKSAELCENDEGKLFVHITYALHEVDDDIWEERRHIVKDEDLTALQKQKIRQILSAVANKIKVIEEIT